MYRAGKVSFVIRPHLCPLPQERSFPNTVLVYSNADAPNPAAGFSRTREQFLLLLGEKAGMREEDQAILVKTRLQLLIPRPQLLLSKVEPGHFKAVV